MSNKEFVFDIPQGAKMGYKYIMTGVGRCGLNGGHNGDVGIIITNLQVPDLNKVSSDKIEELKTILEEL